MAATPEKKTKDRLRKLLKIHGAYWFMPVQAGFGAAAHDFLVCYRGQFASIETKAGNKVMTPRQEAVGETISEAGGAVFLYNDVSDGGLEEWLIKHSG